jgi:acetyltransferase-like isoleucine patch superfamily enzyme
MFVFKNFRPIINIVVLLICSPIVILLVLISFFSFQYASLLAANCLLFGKIVRRSYYSCVLKKVGKNLDIYHGVIFSSRDVVIGDNVRIGSYSTVDRCEIQDSCQIAQNVLILSSGSQHKSEYPHLFDSCEGEASCITVIGKHCWIGAGSIIMSSIGMESVVAAGTVVNKPIDNYSLACGVPAHVVRQGIL